jgi:hypothetical protein
MCFTTKIFLDILTRPLIEPYANACDLVYIINKTTSLYCESIRTSSAKEMNCFNYCFKMGFEFDCSVRNCILKFLKIKSNLNHENQGEKITNAFVYI